MWLYTKDKMYYDNYIWYLYQLYWSLLHDIYEYYKYSISSLSIYLHITNQQFRCYLFFYDSVYSSLLYT